MQKLQFLVITRTNAFIRRLDAIYANSLGANKKDGGRIGFANGTPMEESIQVSETVGQGRSTHGSRHLNYLLKKLEIDYLKK